jgi:hypothetical protein
VFCIEDRYFLSLGFHAWAGQAARLKHVEGFLRLHPFAKAEWFFGHQVESQAQIVETTLCPPAVLPNELTNDGSDPYGIMMKIVQTHKLVVGVLLSGNPLPDKTIGLLLKSEGVKIPSEQKSRTMAVKLSYLLPAVFPEWDDERIKKHIQTMVGTRYLAPADKTLLEVVDALDEENKKEFKSMRQDVEAQLLQEEADSKLKLQRPRGGKGRGPTLHHTPAHLLQRIPGQGMIPGCTLNESLTNKQYHGARVDKEILYD